MIQYRGGSLLLDLLYLKFQLNVSHFTKNVFRLQENLNQRKSESNVSAVEIGPKTEIFYVIEI